MKKRRKPRDIIVPCRDGGHNVRLGRGLRFWKRARCRICHSPVDPHRTRRVRRWITNFGWPAKRTLTHRGLWWAVWGYLAFAVAAAVCLWGVSDRWWAATVLLFGPRWVLLLPAGVLILAVLLLDGHLLPLPILSSLIILFPVMGLQTGLGVETPPADPARDIRFVTFNARGGESLVTHPMNLIREWDADIVAVQECGRAFGRVLREMEGWNVDITSSLCLATRFEIVDVVEMEREALEFAGGSGLVVTYLLDSGSGPFFVTNLHLETPRAGFALIRAGRLWEGIPKTKEKSLLRDVELRRARKWVDQYTGAHVVVGDFNTPPESRSYRAWWSDWQNAFSEAGIGLGGTRLNGWIRARIDHILADQSWTIVESRVEQEAGSDHLPVLAVLRRNP